MFTLYMIVKLTNYKFTYCFIFSHSSSELIDMVLLPVLERDKALKTANKGKHSPLPHFSLHFCSK